MSEKAFTIKKVDRSALPSCPEWLRRLEHLGSGPKEFDLRSDVQGCTHSRQRVEDIYRELKVDEREACLNLQDGLAIQQVIKIDLFRELFPGDKKLFLFGTKGVWKYYGGYTLYTPFLARSARRIFVGWYCQDNPWQPNFLDLRFRKKEG